MRSVNKVIIIGNLTRDPEMKATQNGQNICTFGVATNREWVTGGGEKKKSTEFHEIVAWSRLADICSKFLKKGKLVYLEGYLKRRSWDAENGEKKFKTEIVLEDMIILSRKPNEEDVDLPVYESSEPLSDDIGENIF
ncbi:MAG: single-stranded DNA-binding protein [Candidatus Gracilibacteria bacterium]|nr:single-stranded DNA-binding protein [Candidatus Gracilibacteria bacterium]